MPLVLSAYPRMALLDPFKEFFKKLLETEVRNATMPLREAYASAVNRDAVF